MYKKYEYFILNKTALLLSLCLFLSFSLLSQDITIKDFQFMEGNWKGELQYLDYGDNKTLITLPTRFECNVGKRKVKYTYFYTEPNGQIIKDKGKLKIKGNQVIFEGDKYAVSKNEKQDIVLQREGKDNGQQAAINRQIILKDGQLLITKAVTINNDAFLRNKHTFQK